VSYYNFDTDPPNSLVSSVGFTGNAGLVTGADSGVYAPPSVSSGNGASLIGTVVGDDITGSPTGDQGGNGTFHANIVSTLPFDRRVARNSSHAFEFDNLAYDPTDPKPVPEQRSLALFGLGLAEARAARRRRSRPWECSGQSRADIRPACRRDAARSPRSCSRSSAARAR
jgi:hypothetical protein